MCIEVRKTEQAGDCSISSHPAAHSADHHERLVIDVCFDVRKADLSTGGVGKEHAPTLERDSSHNHIVRVKSDNVKIGDLDSIKADALRRLNATTSEEQGNRTARNESVVGHHLLGNSAGKGRSTSVLRSRKLDIVIAHYDIHRIDAMKEFWLWFFDLEVVCFSTWYNPRPCTMTKRPQKLQIYLGSMSSWCMHLPGDA